MKNNLKIKTQSYIITKIIYLRRFSKYQDIIVNGDYNLLEFNNDNIFSYIRKQEEKH